MEYYKTQQIMQSLLVIAENHYIV